MMTRTAYVSYTVTLTPPPPLALPAASQLVLHGKSKVAARLQV